MPRFIYKIKNILDANTYKKLLLPPHISPPIALPFIYFYIK